MASEPLPDHYKALGVDKSADTTTIKATYRKLVLKCHPDKVTDPALKEQKQEEFHKIQQAYEVLVDDERRATYEASLTLESLRKEAAARRAANPSTEKSARFDIPTRGGATMRANGPTRYATEERKPSRAYDEEDRYYEERSRSKYDTYPVFPKAGASPQSKRSEKESSSKSARPTSDRTRSERNKNRDKEERRERRFNYPENESSGDDKAHFENSYKRRSAEDDMRRKAEERRSYEETRYATTTSARKMSALEQEALRYQHKSKTQVEEDLRPSPHRTSSRDNYYESSRSTRKESRPEPVRRSSAVRTKERTSTSSGRDRDRGIPEIVEWGSDRRPPTMKHSSSSPANIEIPRAMPQRSYTEGAPREHRSSHSPPAMHRSATMPTVPHVSSSSRRKEATVPRPSGLRETMTPEHGGLERDYPSVPPPQPTSASKTKYYHYPTLGAGIPLHADDITAGGHRTVLREPERQRHRSPSPLKTPLARPPMGVNRPSEANIKAARPVSPTRGRSERPLYGEVRTEHPRRQASYSPSDIQYTKRYGPDDIRWAPRGRENERGYEHAPKPAFHRATTFVH